MDLRLEEDFVRVEVADSGDEGLVHEEGLDCSFSVSQSAPELVEREAWIERVRPEFRDLLLRLPFPGEADVAEKPLADVSET